jgi:hypothetical protein
MNYAFLPFKRLIVFVICVGGMVFVGREALHTLNETQPYPSDVKRAASAGANYYWLTLGGGKLLTRQAVQRDVKSRYSRFYQIYVPLVPANWNGRAQVRVVALFDGATRDEAVQKVREALSHANGGEVTVTGTRVSFVDPREYFPDLALAEDCFVLGSGRTPWSWGNVVGASAVCLVGAGFGAWPMLVAMRESRRDAEEWEAATAPPQRRMPTITVG